MMEEISNTQIYLKDTFKCQCMNMMFESEKILYGMVFERETNTLL